MKTGKKMLAVMFAVVFMMVAGAGLAYAETTSALGEVSTTRGRVEKKGDTTDAIFDRWGEQIQADLKSGMSLEQVMAKAKEKGIPIEKVVEGCIKAGVKPSDVVYIAILDNKGSASAIVKAALNLGAKFDDVVLSAKSAGVSKKDVNAMVEKMTQGTGKLQQMQTDVSRIYADNTLSYSPPADNKSASDAKYSNSVFTYSVIYTGGSTPSTKTASPIM